MDGGEHSGSPPTDDDFASPNYDVEPFYYSIPGKNGGRSWRGKAFRYRADNELKGFQAHNDVIYKPGDHVFVEATPNEPYIVGSIVSFKMSKRDTLTVKITRFYRPEDVPEISLSLMMQERNEMNFPQEDMQDIYARELFSSETTCTYSISCLRGKVEIAFVKDIHSVGGCDLSREDCFFSCLSFNHESSRLAAVQGEIRVGSSYQAKLPPVASTSVSEEADRDELLYRPGQISKSLEAKYIKFARCFRIFSTLSANMVPAEKCARVSDLLFDDSLVTLHRCGYKFDEALAVMNANDRLLSADANFMTADDVKKFGKGIKTYGKNFTKINRELLPHHSREQLVGFYYLWKKTPEATKPKALPRQRNQTATLKRASKNGQNKASRPASTELLDYASASESEIEAMEAEGKAPQYACHHCYGSKSRDWHHASREGLLLCTDCRLYFKKYGQLRPVDRPSTVPQCLFKRSPSGEEEESGVRTRAGKKERKRTPSMGDERRSPSEINGEIDEKAMLKTKNGRKNGKRHLNGSINGSAKKIKKEEDKDSESGKDERDEETPSATATPLKDNRSESPKETPVKEESTNGNENGLSVSTSTPAAVMVNGHAKEEPMDTHTQQESTSNGIATCEEKESDDDNEFVPEDPNDDGTWQAGDEVGYTTTNKELKFTLATVRKCGQLSARTDLCFRWKKGWSIEMQAKKRQEEERNRLQQQANSQQPQGLNLPIDKPLHPMPIITTPTQIKKPEFPNGLPPNVMELMARGSIPSAIAQQIAAGINPPVSVFGAAPGVNQIDPNVLMMLHHHHQQQQQQQQQMQAAFHAHLMHQAAQQSQMQQIEQQQRLEMQRQLIMAQQAERERQVQAAQAAERERQQREQAERERQQREAEARAQAQAQAQAIAASQQAQRLMMNPPFSVADQQSRLPVGMAPPGSAPNSSAPQQGGNPPAGMAQPPFAGMHPEQLRIMEFMQAQHQMNALMQSCPPEMQQLMMAQLSGGGAAAANNPLIHSMLQAQQQQAVQQQLAAAAAAGGVNPAALMAMMMPPNSQANVNSDMMRRLQQEGFQNAALRH